MRYIAESLAFGTNGACQKIRWHYEEVNNASDGSSNAELKEIVAREVEIEASNALPGGYVKVLPGCRGKNRLRHTDLRRPDENDKRNRQ